MLTPFSIVAASILVSLGAVSCSRPASKPSAQQPPAQASPPPAAAEQPRKHERPLPKLAHPIQAPASKIIDEELAQLHPGLITHNIPDRMVQGKETYVAARIINVAPGTPDAVKQAEQALTKNFSKGARTSENIQVSRTMKVELKGAEEDFRIELQRSEEQIVDSSPPAEWAWIVIPKKFGSHRLTLSAVAVVKLAGTEKSKELAVFDRDIPINISFGYLASEHWKEIGGAISGTGFIGWITTRFQKRRRQRKRTPRVKAAGGNH